MNMRRISALLLLTGLAAACGATTTAPSGRFHVTFTSDAPDQCSRPCLTIAWVDQASVDQGLLRLAIRLQNIPSAGISSVEEVLSGKVPGSFSQSTSTFVFSKWTPGEFCERLGKPVRYEVNEIASSICCATFYSVGFPTPAATDSLSGNGTVVVLTYQLQQAGVVDLNPGIGLFDGFRATPYGAQVRVE